MNLHAGIFNVAVMTVCVPAETAERVVNTVEGMSWLVTSANFDSYISTARRPYFGPQLKPQMHASP